MNVIWMLSIGLGGALGSISRFGVSHVLNQGHPWGTLTINVLGSLILGGLFAASKNGHIANESPLFAFLAIGFCGAFTTFSTFSLEVFKILGEGHIAAAVGHVLSNLVLAFAAVCGGFFTITHLLK
ncbi:MAG: fluoride efflux transporter CrcB [Opitutales bacterium]